MKKPKPIEYELDNPVKESNYNFLFYILLCAVIGFIISYVFIKAFDNHEKEIEFLRLQKENLKLDIKNNEIELQIKQLEIKKLNCT